MSLVPDLPGGSLNWYLVSLDWCDVYDDAAEDMLEEDEALPTESELDMLDMSDIPERGPPLQLGDKRGLPGSQTPAKSGEEGAEDVPVVVVVTEESSGGWGETRGFLDCLRTV